MPITKLGVCGQTQLLTDDKVDGGNMARFVSLQLIKKFGRSVVAASSYCKEPKGCSISAKGAVAANVPDGT